MFAELLGRSCFSFLRGASQPEEMVARARRLGLNALALCDRNGLYGTVRAWTRARELGQRLIVGAELTVDCSEKTSGRPGAWDARATYARGHSQRKVLPAPGHVVAFATESLRNVALLVQNHRGYSNLCHLLTLAHADLPKGESCLSLSSLGKYTDGLIALVPVSPACTPQSPYTLRLLETLHTRFGDRAFLGVYRYLDAWDQQRTAWTLELSQRFGLLPIASARPLMHHRSRKSLLDVLWCIRKHITLEQAGTSLLGNAEARLRSEAQMLRLFRDRPEWVSRAGEVAALLDFDLSELKYHFPCTLEPGETADAKLSRLTRAGSRIRYPKGLPETVAAQIERELGIISELGMAAYFLSTWEVVQIARRRKILCQGRGSAANSAVCYALGITAVDPARSNLLFERFMSAERHEPPDIDIDFEHERREEVIQEIYERYGRHRAAMVSEVICYRGKSALREVAKVFGLPSEQIDRLTTSVTHWEPVGPEKDPLRSLGFDEKEPRLQRIVQLAQRLKGFPRHLSIHVGGFVLSATDLREVAPVEPARMQDRTVIPWDKDDLDALGFFKVDVLGLGMLTAIRKCLELLHREPTGTHLMTHEMGSKFDPIEALARIPPEDPRVYAMIGRADTVGIFQIESRAQMSMLPRLRPRCFYDLVIEVAIVRPGPIHGGMVHPYLRRRNGQEPVTYPHAALECILKRTLGVPLFQEQVMQIAIVGAGYSGGEADQLRRDMAAWKKNGHLLRHRGRLLSGFARTGISPEFGEALFEQIKGFGDYGFPESHAASFALLVYASAWLKFHAAAHFTCALLNAQPMGFYSPSSLVRDAQNHGVRVEDVCALRSEYDCTLERLTVEPGRTPCEEMKSAPAALRLGLRLVRGLGHSASQRIVAARELGSMTELSELVTRADLKRDAVEALAEAGALEAVLPGRRQALWKAHAPRLRGLFEGLELAEPKAMLPRLQKHEKLVLDYETKGLSIDDHPLKYLRERLKRRGVLEAAALTSVRHGLWVRVAGLVVCRQQPMTASGIVFITLEDETGDCNLVLQRQVLSQFSHEARHAPLLLASGWLERHQDPEAEVAVVHLLVRRLERLRPTGAKVRSVTRNFR